MARTVEIFEQGGLDSRSNPLNFPPNRALRNVNWNRTEGGWLRLRHGFSAPTMSAVVTTSAIHSAFQYEQEDGSRFILFGQGTALKEMELGSVGTVTQLATLSASDQFNAFFANNQLFLGNGTDKKFYDGTTLRDIGIRSPTQSEADAVTVSTDSGAGSWVQTALTGYQLYMMYWNATTQHAGNRIEIGSRFEVTTSPIQVVLTGLPDLSGEDTEFLKVIGRTPDGGGPPSPLVDTNNDFITVANAATGATFTVSTIDATLEMPTRNGLPPNFSKCAYAMGRAYCIDSDNPSDILYSTSEFDIIGSVIIGRPEQSWPPNNRLPTPNAEAAQAMHEVDNDIWVWTRNMVMIYTELGASNLSNASPLPALRGMWVGGIAGQRAFIKTPYGPYWVSHDRELMTRGQNGPIVVSGEYAALLKKLDIAKLSDVELSYLRDPDKQIDRLYIFGRDTSDAAVEIVHDFALRSSQSLFGEASEYSYTGITPEVFVRTPQNVISMRDDTGKWRLWTGDDAGKFLQLEDGVDDDGSTYSAQYVTIADFGPEAPTVNSLEYQGDAEVQLRITPRLNLSLAELDALPAINKTEQDVENARYRFDTEIPAQQMVLNLTKDSELSESLDLNTDPHIPLEVYGNVYVLRPEIGRGRRQGGKQP